MVHRAESRIAATSPWLDPGYEPVDLPCVTAARAVSFRDAAERVGLSLVIDCPRLLAPASVDRGSWETIVDTLLANAIRNTARGRILVSLYVLGHRFVLSVSDTGAGLSYADLARVFSRGYGGRRTRPRHRSALGIDLSLVQELAQLHCGENSVNSIEGQGLCFTVSIPVGTHYEAAEALQRRTTQPLALTGD